MAQATPARGWWQPRPDWRWWLLAGPASAAGVWILWILPMWLLVWGGEREGLAPEEWATACAAARTLLVQIVGGLGLLSGVALNARSLDETRRHNQNTQQAQAAQREQDRQAQAADRFDRAIEQLGHDSLSVRLGAVYALESLSKDFPEVWWASVMEVLAAHVRTNRPLQRPVTTGMDPFPQDYQAVLDVLGRSERPASCTALFDLSDTDLRGAKLAGEGWAGTGDDRVGVVLDRSDLRGANLDFSNLSYASMLSANLMRCSAHSTNLTHAYLQQATLQNARLCKANLQHADMWRANLQGADLSECFLTSAIFWLANLSTARLDYADASNANLKDANLQGASLNNIDFRAADLFRANLTGVDASCAHLTDANLSLCMLEQARFIYTKLDSAKLIACNLTGADLWCASLVQADLSVARLQRCNLISANLEGADLSRAQGLTQSQLDTANGTPRNLPGGLLPPRAEREANREEAVLPREGDLSTMSSEADDSPGSVAANLEA